MFLNIQAGLGAVGTISEEGITIGLDLMSTLYTKARHFISDRQGNGIFTADILEVAERAKSPKELADIIFKIESVGKDGRFVVGDGKRGALFEWKSASELFMFTNSREFFIYSTSID